MKKTTLLTLALLGLSFHSCSNDGEVQKEITEDVSTPEEQAEENINILTSGKSKVWRINSATLQNTSGSIDISENFNIQDDEFVFTFTAISGKKVGGTMEWRQGNSVETTASTPKESQEDYYRAPLKYQFELGENPDDILIIGNETIYSFENSKIVTDANGGSSFATTIKSQDGATIDVATTEKKPEDYPTFYGFEHANIAALSQAQYGLAEWQHDDIANTNLVAVPGCYPTASLLSLKPITSNNLHLENSLISVNGISGVSGAGRTASLATNFNEVSLKPYNILQHRHQPEISQEANAQVIFNPHLAPYKRGLLATVTLQLKADVTTEQVDKAFAQAYEDKPLVRMVNTWPQIGNVEYTPFADLHWQVDEEKHVVVISCAIDNLLKGASSQALQCFNISLGLPSEYSLLASKL